MYIVIDGVSSVSIRNNYYVLMAAQFSGQFVYLLTWTLVLITSERREKDAGQEKGFDEGFDKGWERGR